MPKRILSLFRNLFRKRAVEQALDDELRSSVEALTQEKMKDGVSQSVARREALMELGGIEQVKEGVRAIQTGRFLEDFARDIRFAFRTLAKSPGFTIVAVLTLAIGIGLNTSIFNLFDAVALRPLPVRDPNAVVSIYQRVENDPGGYRPFSYPEYVALRDANNVFSGLGAYSWITVQFTAGVAGRDTVISADGAEEAHGLLVSGNYFSVVGGEAALGRTFGSDEDQPGGSHEVVVLSHPFWKRRFDSDPAVLGKDLDLNGKRFTVVGVARQDFTGTEPQIPDFWVPLTAQGQLMPTDDRLRDRGSFWLELIARLRPGVTRTQAQASMGVLIARFSQTYLGTREKAIITLTPGSFLARPDVRGEIDSVAFLVMAAVGMVLLIACANVASLLLTRATGRQKEIGIRLSLGATRGRLIQQLLVESLLIALLGAGVGLLLAWWLPSSLIEVLQPPYEQPFILHLRFDITVLAYTLLLSVATGVVCGLAPALQASKSNLLSAIKDEGTSFGRRLSRSRLHNLLVIAEISTCLVLLMGAGLLLRGLDRAQNVDPGFDTKHVLVVSLDLDVHGYDDTRAAEFHRTLTDRVLSVPGVKSVSVASLVPLGGVSRAASITVAGKNAPPDTSSRLWDFWVVSSNYFETLGIPITRGRSFSAQDAQGGPPVAIINEAMAREVWPGEDPLGKRLRLGPPSVPFTEVVGVVKDTRGARLWEADKPYVYLPLLLSSQGPPVQTGQLGMKLLVRTEGNPEVAAALLARVVRALDPSVHATATVLANSLGRWLWFSQVGAALSSILGLLALLLAAVGIYGVVSYSVTRRTQEMGIRMAIGARQTDVLKLVVGQGLRLTLLGLAIGEIASLAATRMVEGMIYGLKATDPVTLAAVSLLLTAIAMLACYIPARRATQVDPMVALRYE
jgi:macrolide transport system ATP-binding/permease protein